MPKSTQWSACTAQLHNGSFCDAPGIPDAPFPICTKHASQLYAFIRESIDDASSDPERTADAMMALCASRQVRSVPTDASSSVVYYLQVGDHIKIGYSANLARRLKTYPLNRRLLATEPGGEAEESHRLAEFAEFRDMGREWFRPGPALIEHINALRRKQRASPVVIAA